jgi:hypothetical protein
MYQNTSKMVKERKEATGMVAASADERSSVRRVSQRARLRDVLERALPGEGWNMPQSLHSLLALTGHTCCSTSSSRSEEDNSRRRLSKYDDVKKSFFRDASREHGPTQYK